MLTIFSALAAGACFAVAAVLQQREASVRPEGESGSFKLLGALARRRVWLAGIGMAVLSYAFQSVALATGPLSLVQPIIISEILFAIPIAARFKHVDIGRRTWAGAAAVVVGLAVALGMAAPHGGDPRASLGEWLMVTGAVTGLVLVALAVRERVGGVVRASMLAAAAASVMGTQSALLDLTIENLRDGPVALFTAWQTYLLVVASFVGLMLIQSAFQEGPLAASLPVIDAVEPAVAVAIGILLFDEALASETWRLVAAGVGAALAVVGIWTLDTAPTVQALHEQDEKRRESSQSGDAGETREDADR